MMLVKKNLFKLSLIFILLLSSVLSIYTIWNYKSNANFVQNKMVENNMFSGEKKESPNNFHQMEKNEKQPPQGNQQLKPNSSEIQMHKNNGQQANTTTSINSKYSNINSKYSKLLIAYSIIFFGLFAAAYYFIKYKKIKIYSDNKKMFIFTILCVGFLLRISAATFIEGHPYDINIFKSWATSAANSLSKVYSNSGNNDYPPLYMYILFLIGKVASIPIMSNYYTLLLKLPSIIADVATSYLIYKLAKKHLSIEISFLISAFYVFNPAIFINSTLWGQVDSFFTLIVVFSIVLLSEKKIVFSAILFTVAVLMKPQGIIYIPILLFELIRQKSFKNFAKIAVAALIAAAVIILPFCSNKDILWIFKLYASTIGEYPYASVNAFNFFSLIGGNYVNDTSTLFIFSYHMWGLIFIILITAFSWFIYIKENSSLFAPVAALIQIVGVFTFSVGMHERYLFPAAALSVLAYIYIKDRRILLLSAGLSAAIYINTHTIFFGTFKGINSASFGPTLIVTSLLNILCFAYLVKIIIDIVIKKKTLYLT